MIAPNLANGVKDGVKSNMLRLQRREYWKEVNYHEGLYHALERVAGAAGIEPATCGFGDRCSTS